VSRRSPIAQRRPASRVHSSEPLEPRLFLAVGPASLVKDIQTLGASSEPFSFVPFKGATYFRADDGVHGVEWFRTDGTPGGTSLLVDLSPGAAGSFTTTGFGNVDPRSVATAAALGDALLFVAFTPATGAELWKTDGTATGTILVKDINPTGSSTPQRFIAAGDTLYFTANDGTHGPEIWKTDGTADGTQRVTDLPGPTTASPIPLAAAGGRLVFSGWVQDHSSGGFEPWATDGTAAGTVMLKNINPAGGSDPGIARLDLSVDAAVVGNRLYFAATDDVHGRELWSTDGTPGGTVFEADLLAGNGSSSPDRFTNVNDHLYFTASLTGSTNPGESRGVYL
jgi:ELWxxDGT repeat protein